jgi:4-amino-4-deoxy-L-arabinose transferase-like glycosyltransferase
VNREPHLLSVSTKSNQFKETLGGAKPGHLIFDRTDLRNVLLLLALALLCFLPGLGSFGILDPSDGYYSEGAREMVESGDFLTPHLNYVPWFDKPILTYWLIAAAYKIIGVSEFAARLPSALCASGLVAILYVFGRQFLRRRAALFSSLILLSSPMWLIVGHLSMTDMPLCFFTWLSLGSFFLSIASPLQWFVYLGYLSLALAVLCKGPLAIILVSMNLIGYMSITLRSKDDWMRIVRRLRLLPGLALAFCATIPWYAAEISTTHGAFFQEFFVNQNLNRALGVVDHRASAFYYLPVLLGGFFPWIIVALALAAMVFRSIRRFFQKPRLAPASSRLLCFSSVTALITLAFFSILPTKLATYVLPVFPALSLMVAISLDRLLVLGKTSRLRWTGPVLSVIVFVTLTTLVFLHVTSRSLVVPLSFLLVCSIYCLAFLFYAFMLWKQKYNQAVRSLLVSSVFCTSVLVMLGLQIAYDLKDKDFHALLLRTQSIGTAPLLVGRRNPSAMFYLHKRVKFFPEANALASYIQSTPGQHLILISTGSMKKVRSSVHSITMIESCGDWYLAVARGDRFGQEPKIDMRKN